MEKQIDVYQHGGEVSLEAYLNNSSEETIKEWRKTQPGLFNLSKEAMKKSTCKEEWEDGVDQPGDVGIDKGDTSVVFLIKNFPLSPIGENYSIATFGYFEADGKEQFKQHMNPDHGQLVLGENKLSDIKRKHMGNTK